MSIGRLTAALLVLVGLLPVSAGTPAAPGPGVGAPAADGRGESDKKVHALQTHGPVTLTTTAPVHDGRLAVAFTDEILLTVEIRGKPGLRVSAPRRWAEEPWQVSRVEPASVEKMADGVRWSQRFWLAPPPPPAPSAPGAPGEASLELAALQYRAGQGPWQQVAWQPIPVTVTARLKTPESATARDITSIEELPPAPQGGPAGWVAGFVIGVAVIVIVAWLWQRTGRRTPGRSPEAWALGELDRLAALRLAERGRSERLATLLAGLVRRYVEKKHHVPARRQTTAEFLAGLPPALAAQRGWLEAFLTRCDQIKFAPIEAHAGECEQLVAEVRNYLVSSNVTDTKRTDPKLAEVDGPAG